MERVWWWIWRNKLVIIPLIALIVIVAGISVWHRHCVKVFDEKNYAGIIRDGVNFALSTGEMTVTYGDGVDFAFSTGEITVTYDDPRYKQSIKTYRWFKRLKVVEIDRPFLFFTMPDTISFSARSKTREPTHRRWSDDNNERALNSVRSSGCWLRVDGTYNTKTGILVTKTSIDKLSFWWDRFDDKRLQVQRDGEGDWRVLD